MLVLFWKYNMLVLEKYISERYFRIFKSTDFEDFGEKKYLSLKESNGCNWYHYFLSRPWARHLSQKYVHYLKLLGPMFQLNTPTTIIYFRFRKHIKPLSHTVLCKKAQTSKELATTNRPCTQPWVGIPNTQANNVWENTVELAERSFPSINNSRKYSLKCTHIYVLI